MSPTKTITLGKPIVHDGRTIAELVLREQTLGEVLAAEKSYGAETGLHIQRVRDTNLVALVTGIPVDAVRRLPAGALKEAAAFLASFSVAPAADSVASSEPEMTLPMPRIEKNGRIVDELELREPTTGEVEEAERKFAAGFTSAAAREYQIHLIALVADVPRFIVHDMPVSIADRASRYLVGFT